MPTETKPTMWYYSENNKEHKGPISQSEIETLVNKGKIKKTFLCWSEGMPAWEKISLTDAFSGAFKGIEEDIQKIESLTGANESKESSKAVQKTKKRKRAQKKSKWKTIEFFFL